LEEIDYSSNKGLDQNQVECLAVLVFVKKNKVLFITGSAGTRKIYPATALDNKACQEGYRVFYVSTAKMMSRLKSAKL
jgi:DNA replication protein DnaC